MGRPASFKPQDLMEDITALFWRQGYFATSVADLGETTGLNPGSLYNAFGNKRGVLTASLEYYGRRSVDRARKALQQTDDIELAINGFFDALIDAVIEDEDAKGCFLVNTWLETAAHDDEVKAQIQRIFDGVEEQFRNALSRAQKRGMISSEADIPVLSQYLMMTIWGLRVKGRMVQNRELLQAMVEQATSAIRQVVITKDYDLAL
ncbi:MAG: TetR/AcrR family transcriptional regulator [Motiliproteus sp.]